MKSPDNFRAVDDLRLLMGFKVVAVVAPAEQIDKVLAKRYSGEGTSMATIMAELGESDTLAALAGRGESIDLEALAQAAEDNQVVRVVHLRVTHHRTSIVGCCPSFAFHFGSVVSLVRDQDDFAISH